MASIQELIGATMQLQGHAGVHRSMAAPILHQPEQGPNNQLATSITSNSSIPAPVPAVNDPSLHQFQSSFPGPAQFDEQNADYFDFEGYFQELQDSLCQPGSYPTNEVLHGFEQEWFGLQYPS